MDVLTWCRHNNVAGLNQSICISQPSLLVSESPSNSNTDINKQFIKKNTKNTKIRLHAHKKTTHYHKKTTHKHKYR